MCSPFARYIALMMQIVTPAPVTVPVKRRAPLPADATHCHDGHAFTPDNVYRDPRGRRRCRRCERIRNRKRGK